MAILTFDHLKKYYGKQRGVEDATFSIEEGEIFGFIGPNGSGKSTTLRCALSLIFPTSGSISIFGLDSVKDRVEIAQHVGYLPGEVFFYGNMRVKDFLAYSGSFYNTPSDKRRAELCDMLQLDMSKKIQDLSLGNKKKIGIVQAFQHEPKLLMLDEPTSGLDPLMQKHFFELVHDARDKGATVLFSSHVLSEVKRLSDRIAIIRSGVVTDVQHVAELEHANYKHVSVEADEAVLAWLETQLSFEVTSTAHGMRAFMYRGNLSQLLATLSQVHLDNVTIEDPSLEEVFLRYYEEDASSQPDARQPKSSKKLFRGSYTPRHER